MEDTQVLNNINKGILDFGSVLDTKLEEFGKKLPAKIEEIEQEKAGALEGISSMKVWDIPVGQALVGGFSAVVVSELVDGFLAKQTDTVKGMVKLVAAGAVAKWGGRLLGKTGTTALVILLAYDGLRQILPIDEWASRLTGGVTKLTGGGLGGRAGITNVVTQAQKVAADYYAAAEGR